MFHLCDMFQLHTTNKAPKSLQMLIDATGKFKPSCDLHSFLLFLKEICKSQHSEAPYASLRYLQEEYASVIEPSDYRHYLFADFKL